MGECSGMSLEQTPASAFPAGASRRRGRAYEFVDVHGCYPGQLPLTEIAQSEFSEDFAFEQRLRGVRDEYLPRLGRAA